MTVKLPDWIDNDEVIARFSYFGNSKLPPWTGDDPAMLRWLKQRLSAMAVESSLMPNDDATYPLLIDPPLSKLNTKNVDLPDAIKLAKLGHIEPLRKLYPDIAEFIHLPKRKRGQRFPNPMAELNPIKQAALDAQRIRALWKKFYSGHRRPRGNSAEDFAARLWGKDIPVAKILNRLRKMRTSK
jgi:hypothetical protein